VDPLLEFTLVLALLALFECAHWITRQSAAFGKRWRRYAIREGESLFGNERAGFALAWPLPPFGALWVFEAPPFHAGETRVLGLASGRTLEWQDVGDVAAHERQLMIGGVSFAECSSARAALEWRDWLAKRASESQTQRRTAREQLAKELCQPERLRSVCAQMLPQRGKLVLLIWIEFALLFGGLPLTEWTLGLARGWPWLLAALLSVHGLVVWRFARAHRALFPARVQERRMKLLALSLSPPAALRALDVLSRDALPRLEPLAAASFLLEQPDFVAYARQRWREHAFLKPQGLQPETREWVAVLRPAMERLLDRAGLPRFQLAAAPQRLGADVSCYCPRCERQFTHAKGSCEACGGVPLVDYARAASNRVAS
jgi:hypothetical protein